MVVNDKILVPIYNICIHDVPNFFLFFQYFQVTQFVCKFFFLNCYKSPKHFSIYLFKNSPL